MMIFKIDFIYYFILLQFCQVGLSKVVTLKNSSTCTCMLTAKDVYAGAYWNFPNETIKRSLDELGFNFKNDWKYENVEFFNFAPVTDQRWESFTFESLLPLEESKSISFSMYTNKIHRFQIQSQDFEDAEEFYLPDSVSKNQRWTHYTAKIKDSEINIFLQNGSLHKSVKTNFTPMAITVDDIEIKRHKYNISFSEDITQKEAPTYDLHLEESKCLTMFVSIDNDCYLNIILKSYNHTYTYTERGFNKKNYLKKWKRIEIKPDFSGNASLSFSREHNGKGKCFWAISQIYKLKKIDLFQIDNYKEGTDCFCKVLNEDNDEAEEEHWIVPAVLDADNDINCSHVLGEQYPFCENYQICSEEKCYCAWGFNGSSCTERCPEGYWDLDCRSKCKKECEECDYKKGCIKCKEGLSPYTCSYDHPEINSKEKTEIYRKEENEISSSTSYVNQESISEFSDSDRGPPYDNIRLQISSKTTPDTVLLVLVLIEGVLVLVLVLCLVIIVFKNSIEEIISNFSRTENEDQREEHPLNNEGGNP